MNILYITSKKHWGGVSTWMQKTAQGLERKGHHIWILAHPKGRFIKSVSKSIKIIPKKLGMDYNPLMIYFLSRFIKKNQIDLIVTNIEKEVIIGGIAARICRIPNIRRVGREDDFNEKVKVKWHHRLLVDHCIVPCDFVRDNALKRAKWLDPAQFTTIYNGENKNKFSKDEIRRQRKEWGLSDMDLIIGTTSQITKVKGIEQVIVVFQKIFEQYPNCHLVITGEGPEKQNLENLAKKLNISEHVKFAGYTSEPVRVAAGYDIAVSNSRFEGFPNTVVEYFAAGKPVITTDAGGLAEMVKEGENAFLIQYDDNSALYDRLLFLINNHDVRKRLSQNAINTIEEKFSKDIMIENLETLFKNILS